MKSKLLSVILSRNKCETGESLALINLVFGEFVTFEDALGYLTGTFGLHGIAVEDIKGLVESNYRANRCKFGNYRMNLYACKEENREYR